jgi:hypothetical protein
MLPGRKTFPDRKPSAVRLREKLAEGGTAMRMYQTEALYHTQVEWTCQLLGAVDEVTDAATAERITDAVCARLTGNDADEAAVRAWDTAAEVHRLMREGTPG